MKDDDFRDWRRDEELPRDPDGAGEVDPPSASEGYAADAGYVVQPSPVPTAPGPAGVQAQAISCPNCQYNLTGATIGMACPECGMIVGAGLMGVGSGMPTSGKAVAALVLGIVSIFGCFFYAIPSMICGPLALIFARQAKGQMLRGEVNPSSESMSMAGFVCGLIGTIIGAVVLVIILVLVVIAVANNP